MTEKTLTIGAGTMGQIIAGEEAVSLRRTEVFDGLLGSADIVILATRQEDGLRWLKRQSRFLSGKTVVSLMAFVSFETLETAVGNAETRFVRIMTDTSFKEVVWSDDGRLTNEEKSEFEQWLSQKAESRYIGERNDEEILRETIKACQLGWVAQILDELMTVFGDGSEKILAKVIEQWRGGIAFGDMARAVATSGGATEAGIEASRGMFGRIAELQQAAGEEKAREKRSRLLGFARDELKTV